jgi:hypothetical protein
MLILTGAFGLVFATLNWLGVPPHAGLIVLVVLAVSVPAALALVVAIAASADGEEDEEEGIDE